MTALKIYLSDLTHDTVGPALEIFPLNIGYIGAYCKKVHGSKVELTLFKDIKKLESAIRNDPPDILGASNYPWCHRIDLAMFKILADVRPEALRVMGGPNFPHGARDQLRFMRNVPLLDAHIYLDGEVPFSNLVESALAAGGIKHARQRIRQEGVAGCVILSEMGELVSVPNPIRLKELDEIPSPYLTGILDPFFDTRLTPMISTNRGCPFRCAFCHDGNAAVSKVNSFSRERAAAEVKYISEHVSDSVHGLFISDLNFGMYKQDLDICEAISQAQINQNYPKYIDTTTGKNAKRRVISAIEKLNGALRLTMSIQSMDDHVLENIDRENIRIDDFLALQPAIRSAKLPTVSEVILGLPGETFESHIKTLRDLLDVDIDLVVPYTLMLLHGTELNTPESREKWGFKTKFRILPRDFTKLSDGTNVVEVEEVVVETSTLSFEDYVNARKIALLIAGINTVGFRALRRFLHEQEVNLMDLLLNVMTALEASDASFQETAAAPQKLKLVLAEFEQETIGELWDTENELLEFFAADENFEGLVDGTYGKNLLQSYSARLLANTTDDLFSCVVFHARECLISNHTDDLVLEQFDDITRYCNGRMNNLLGDDRMSLTPEAWVRHDVGSWLDDAEGGNLGQYSIDRPTLLRFHLSREQFEEVEDALDLFGRTPSGQAKVLNRVSANTLWRTPIWADSVPADGPA